MLNESKWNSFFKIIELVDDFKNNINNNYKNIDISINKFINKLRIEIITLSSKYANNIFIKLLYFYIDEIILKLVFKKNIKWSLLQLEYFKVNNGGQYFFEILDDLLKNISIDSNSNNNIFNKNELIFNLKVSYFLLKYGFVGKFYNDKDSIDLYLTKIKEVCVN